MKLKRILYWFLLTICFSSNTILADENIFSIFEKMDQNKEKIMQKYNLSNDKEFQNFKTDLLKKYTNQNTKKILLNTKIWHYKQIKALSCEANTAKDLINYYRSQKGEQIIHEQEVIDNLPTENLRIWRLTWKHKNKFYRSDPDKVFVWKINGRQSSKRSKFTGYGIHPKWIKPVLEKYLKNYWVTIKESERDETKVINSLKNGHPVMMRYVSSKKDWTTNHKKFIRYTKNNKKIEVYIWEHTALVVWIDLEKDKQWNDQIKNLYYYEWLTNNLQKTDYKLISKTIELQNKILFTEKKI